MTGPLPDSPAPPPDQKGLYRRFALGMASKLVSFTIQFADQFLMVPLFLLLWGPERYGDWLVLMSAAVFAGLIDLGMQVYLGNALQMIWARGEREAFARMLHNGLAIYAVAGLVVVPLVIAAGLYAPWESWLNLRGGAALAGATLAMLALYFLITLPMGLVISIYRAQGEFPLGIMVNNARRALLIAATAAVLWADGGMAAMAAALLGLSLAFWIAVVIHQKRRYPALRFGLAKPAPALLREMAAVCPFYAVPPAGTALTLQGTVLLISALAGAGATLVAFTTTRTLCGVARMIANELGYIPGSEIARQYAQGDAAALARMTRFTGRMIGGLCGGLCGMIAIFGPPFLGIWTVGKVAFDGAVFWPLLAAAAAAAPGIAGAKSLEFSNRPQGLAAAYAGAGVLTVALCLVLIPPLGAAGAAWAVLASEIAVLGIVIPRHAARMAGLSATGLIAATHAASAGCFAVSIAIAWGAVWLCGGDSLARLFAAGVIWLAVAGAASPWLLLNPGQRRGVFERLQRRLR
jgi:O-antigen/teichoic acid export membrane protein